jgi:hypothetical protein
MKNNLATHNQNPANNYQPIFFNNNKMLELWKIYHQSNGNPQALGKFFNIIVKEAEAIIARKLGIKHKDYLKKTSKAIKRLERQQTQLKKL